MNSERPKTPLLRRWWVWALIILGVFVILGRLSSLGSSEETPQAAPLPTYTPLPTLEPTLVPGAVATPSPIAMPEPPDNQDSMDARVNLLPGAIQIINENDFSWYGLRTTIYTNEGVYSDRHLFGDNNWPWLRPDRERKPNEEISFLTHPDYTSLQTEDGKPYSGNSLEGGTLYHTIQSITLEAKTQVDGSYDLAFSIDMEAALATPYPERRPRVLIHPTPYPPGEVGATIYLEHHEQKYDEVMAIATTYPGHFSDSYILPLDKYREVEAILGATPTPVLSEQERRTTELWQEAVKHWEIIDAFVASLQAVNADRVIDLEESRDLCYKAPQWREQMTAVRQYVADYREVDPETVAETPRIHKLETEAYRAMEIVVELEKECQ